MKLTIKAPEGKGWVDWHSWEIKLNDVLLSDLYELRLSLLTAEIATAQLTIAVDDLEFEGDVMGELQAVIDSRRTND